MKAFNQLKEKGEMTVSYWQALLLYLIGYRPLQITFAFLILVLLARILT